MKFLALVSGALALPAPRLVENGGNQLTAYLFEKPVSKADQELLETSFAKVFDQLNDSFDHEAHESFLESFDRSLDLYGGFKNTGADCPSVGTGLRAGSAVVKTFPGGVVSRPLNFDLGKLVDQLAQKASSSAAASGGIGGIVAMQGITMAATFLQGLVSNAVHIIPPMIPPPVWNNQPLMCLPMVTGHNCVGAILHPITTTDFAMASATDAKVNGLIASFPATFADKVGPAPDSLYKACFASYMSMQCGSIFPKCIAPQTGNDPTTKGAQRAPLCFMHCIQTLVACPGFWVDDIIGACSDVSVPPACSSAFFWRMDLLPPQYVSFEDSAAAEKGCPSTDMALPAGLVESGTGNDRASAGAVGQGAGSNTVRLPAP